MRIAGLASRLKTAGGGWDAFMGARNGLRSKRNSCVGCQNPLCSQKGQHKCVFLSTGFTQDGQLFIPCGSAHHLGCIIMGGGAFSHPAPLKSWSLSSDGSNYAIFHF